MSVDLNDYQQNFLFAISPPGQAIQGGTGIFANISATEIVGRLGDAFWTMRIQGMDFLGAWNCSDDGLITPRTGSIGNTLQYLPSEWIVDGTIDAATGLPDLGRQIVQGIILFAAYKCVQMQLINLKTSTAYKAGPVSAEVSQSATVLQTTLRILTAEIDIMLSRLSDLGMTTVECFDAVMNVTRNEGLGDAWWVRGDSYTTGGRSRV